MRIIDKASWQIDGGVQPPVAIAHFKRVFMWLMSKGMLTTEGKEVLDVGIDESVSLHERLITPTALLFLDKVYDDYIKSNPYGGDSNSIALEAAYADYSKPLTTM